MNNIDKSTITVAMNMEQYEYYSRAVETRNEYIKIFERANKKGKAVLTDELRTVIEDIYC